MVGNGEHPHFGHLVTPELDAHRVFESRRENVEDAAAHGELTALADHVHACIGQVDEPRDDPVKSPVEPDFGAHGERDRRKFRGFSRDVSPCVIAPHVPAPPLGHRLQQRSGGGDHDLQRGAQSLVIGVGESAQQHQPRTDGVHAG